MREFSFSGIVQLLTIRLKKTDALEREASSKPKEGAKSHRNPFSKSHARIRSCCRSTHPRTAKAPSKTKSVERSPWNWSSRLNTRIRSRRGMRLRAPATNVYRESMGPEPSVPIERTQSNNNISYLPSPPTSVCEEIISGMHHEIQPQTDRHIQDQYDLDIPDRLTPDQQDSEIPQKFATPPGTHETSRSRNLNLASQPFLSFPGELRNNIYTYLLPEHVNPSKVAGMLVSCKQIRVELGGLLLRSADRALEQLLLGNILVPKMNSYSQLQNVEIAIPCAYGVLPPHQTSSEGSTPPDPGTLCDAFAKVQPLLLLRLTYLTVYIPIDFQSQHDIWQPLVRHSVLRHSLESFYAFNRTGVVNSGNVIFDYSRECIGPFPPPGHRPYIAFKRQEVRAHVVKGSPRPMEKVRYAWLGYDAGWQGPHGEPLEPDERMMAELEKIINASRKLADHFDELPDFNKLS